MSDLGQLAHELHELYEYISEPQQKSIEHLYFSLSDLIYDVDNGKFTRADYVATSLDAIIQKADASAWHVQYIQAIAKQVKRVCINAGLIDQPGH